MYSPITRFRSALVVAAISHLTQIMSANAVRLPSQDAWAVARGHAATASVDSSAAVWFNPAGLRHIEHDDVRLEPSFLSVDEDFRSDKGTTTDETAKHFFTPSAYAAHRVNGSTVVAVGALAPYGLAAKWPTTSEFAGLATDNDLTYRTFVASLAWAPSTTLGLGGSLEYSTLKAGLNRLTPIAPGVVRPFNFSGTDHAVSGNVGVQWDLDDKRSIGVMYQFATSFKLDGTAALSGVTKVPGRTSPWRFADNLAVGYRQRLAPDWDLEFGVDWTFWTGTGTIHLDAGPLSTNLPLNWKTSAYYNIGVEHRISREWRVAAGYQFSENSVPDESLNPSLPDSNRHLLDAGIERAFGQWRVQLFAEKSLEAHRRVPPGTPNGLGSTYSGTFNNALLLVGCSVGYRW